MPTNKNILIIGTTGGIGGQLSDLFREEGDFKTLVGTGSSSLDIKSSLCVKSFFDVNPNINIVINAAGYNHNGFIDKQSSEEVLKQLEINVIGYHNILQACLPHMRKGQFGRIITMSSILSHKVVKGTAIYSGCKSAIETITKVAAAENAKFGITINSLGLGYFNTGLIKSVPENMLKDIIEQTPLKRLGTTREIYNVIRCIINTEYINGANIALDGGLS
jgi:NAD(P)-dependent dehydrogenase (short-subunit alcohol dehydrogenase family)